jgi:hypothetical protein
MAFEAMLPLLCRLMLGLVVSRRQLIHITYRGILRSWRVVWPAASWFTSEFRRDLALPVHDLIEFASASHIRRIASLRVFSLLT